MKELSKENKNDTIKISNENTAIEKTAIPSTEKNNEVDVPKKGGMIYHINDYKEEPSNFSPSVGLLADKIENNQKINKKEIIESFDKSKNAGVKVEIVSDEKFEHVAYEEEEEDEEEEGN